MHVRLPRDGEASDSESLYTDLLMTSWASTSDCVMARGMTEVPNTDNAAKKESEEVSKAQTLCVGERTVSAGIMRAGDQVLEMRANHSQRQ